jgi:hypothetical protein
MLSKIDPFTICFTLVPSAGGGPRSLQMPRTLCTKSQITAAAVGANATHQMEDLENLGRQNVSAQVAERVRSLCKAKHLRKGS